MWPINYQLSVNRNPTLCKISSEVPQPTEPSTPVIPDAPVQPAVPDPGTPADPEEPAVVPPEPDEPATPAVPEPEPGESRARTMAGAADAAGRSGDRLQAHGAAPMEGVAAGGVVLAGARGKALAPEG